VSKRRSPFAAIAAALGLAVIACSACSAKSGEASATAVVPEPRQAVEVEVHEVAPGLEAGSLRASGMVAFKNETTLAFNAAGQIETLTVDQGAQVQAGQVLATLRRSSAGVDAAEADLARRTAQQAYDRVSRLFASGAASQADLDAATLALERAREIVSITAPASGVVLRRDAVRGQVVSAGQSILQLGEARAGVVVRASMSSTDISQVQVGDAAEIEVRGRELRTGKVTQISPKMAAGMGAFEIEARFDNGADLRSGEVAEVMILTRAAAADAAPKAVLFIPAISLIDARADQAMIYVVDDAGVARRRAIRTEGVTDQGVVVVEGLKEGERVISRGASMVRDGDRVNVKKG
jgi:RND family efflux transporter MFP subunit